MELWDNSNHCTKDEHYLPCHIREFHLSSGHLWCFQTQLLCEARKLLFHNIYKRKFASLVMELNLFFCFYYFLFLLLLLLFAFYFSLGNHCCWIHRTSEFCILSLCVISFPSNRRFVLWLGKRKFSRLATWQDQQSWNSCCIFKASDSCGFIHKITLDNIKNIARVMVIG